MHYVKMRTGGPYGASLTLLNMKTPDKKGRNAKNADLAESCIYVLMRAGWISCFGARR